MTDSTRVIHASSCLGRTCLKWQVDGDLAAQDLAMVIRAA